MDYGQYKQLEFRRKFWKLFGASITITDPKTDQAVGFIRMKAWKLKEDIRVFRDSALTQEVLQIHARSVIDISATYDVYEGAAQQPLFALRRKGLRSIFVRDHWEAFTPDSQQFAVIQETSSGLALFRRWIGILPYIGDLADAILGFVPQTYRITDMQGKLMAELTHRKNPFIVKFGMDLSRAELDSDPRLSIATVALLSVIDASKNA